MIKLQYSVLPCIESKNDFRNVNMFYKRDMQDFLDLINYKSIIKMVSNFTMPSKHIFYIILYF